MINYDKPHSGIDYKRIPDCPSEYDSSVTSQERIEAMKTSIINDQRELEKMLKC